MPTFCPLQESRAQRTLHDEFHGTDGPLNVAERPYTNPLSHAFVEAAQQAGLPFNPDFNGAVQLGCGLFQVTQKTVALERGDRLSASGSGAAKSHRPDQGAGDPRRDRERPRHRRRVWRKGKRHTARAEQEVLLAAAPSTRRNFCCSPASAGRRIARLGVKVAHDLPGVGKNLQDHLNVNIVRRATRPITLDGKDRASPRSLAGLQFLLFGTGPGTSNVAEAGAFVARRSGRSDAGYPVSFHPGAGRRSCPRRMTATA